MKTPTLAQCEEKYKAAEKAYCAYLDRTIKAKFGEYRLAAKVVKRSRAHVFDCLHGRRGIDSLRRLTHKIEAAEA